MSDDDMMIGGRALSSLKVTELKEELDSRQLSTKGVKAVLQERLREALSAQNDQLVVKNSTDTSIQSEQARAEAPKQTETETPGSVTPKSELSPSKKSDASPSKRQTPRRGQKTSERKSETDNDEVDVPKKEEIEDVVTEKTDNDTEITDSAPGNSSDSETQIPSEKKNDSHEDIEIQEKKHDSDVAIEESSPKTIEKVHEHGQNESPGLEKETEEERKEEQPVSTEKQLRKEEDGDELDYGDDEEKDQKEEESMDAEDTKEEKVVKSIDKVDKRDNVKKEEKVRGSVSHRRVSSPSSRHPVSNIVHIRGLTRPFTERQLRSEIEKHGGEMVDFWIDKVKSHCFAKLNTSENAASVLEAMNNTVWPDGNPKRLAIVFETDENMTKYKEGRESSILEAGSLGGRADRLSTNSQSSTLGGKASFQITLQNVLRDNDKLDSERKEKRGSLASRLTRIDDKDKGREDRKRGRSETPPFSRGAGFMDEKRAKYDERDGGSRRDEHRRDERRVVQEEVPKKSLEQIFKKTVALPSIYYLPLTEEQIAEKVERKKKRDSGVQDRAERTERNDRDRNRGERNDRGDREDRVDRDSRPRRRD